MGHLAINNSGPSARLAWAFMPDLALPNLLYVFDSEPLRFKAMLAFPLECMVALRNLIYAGIPVPEASRRFGTSCGWAPLPHGPDWTGRVRKAWQP